MVALNPSPAPPSPDGLPQSSPTPAPADGPQPVSDRKRSANRANAGKSTGPRTPEGKARSRLNATRHGFRAELPIEDCPQLEWVVDDDPNAFDDLHEAFVHDLRPRGAAEQLIVERLARAAWRLRRTEAAEIGLLDVAERTRMDNVVRRHTFARVSPHLCESPGDAEMDPTPLSEALAAHFTEQGKERGLLTLMQYQARLEGQVRSCLRDLRLLRQDRAAWDAEQEGKADDWAPPKRPHRKPEVEIPDVREVLSAPLPDTSAVRERIMRAVEEDPFFKYRRRPEEMPRSATSNEKSDEKPKEEWAANLDPVPTPPRASAPTPTATVMSGAPATNEATVTNTTTTRAATNEATVMNKAPATQVTTKSAVSRESASPASPGASDAKGTVPGVVSPSASPPRPRPMGPMSGF